MLKPVDLAVSKIARFSDQDRQDIKLLSKTMGFGYAELQQRAREALSYYIGNHAPLYTTLTLIERDLLTL